MKLATFAMGILLHGLGLSEAVARGVTARGSSPTVKEGSSWMLSQILTLERVMSPTKGPRKSVLVFDTLVLVSETLGEIWATLPPVDRSEKVRIRSDS
jgi:hypothetical protein